MQTDQDIIIAALVGRLGGEVTLTSLEMHRARSGKMVTWIEPRDSGLTITVEMPIEAIDAEFVVVTGEARRIR